MDDQTQQIKPEKPHENPGSSDATLKSADAGRSVEEDQIVDLSDPTAYELFMGDKPAETSRDVHLRDAHRTVLEMDLQHQKGVEIIGERVRVPGRVALWPVTLMQILFNVIGFSFGLIHFSLMSPNYLLTLFIFSGILLVQTLVYHTSYRTMRVFMMVVTFLITLGIMVFVGWALVDLIIYPKFPDKPVFLLKVSLGGSSLNVLTMLVHLVYLGHGYRWVDIEVKKKKKTAAETPTKIIPQS